MQPSTEKTANEIEDSTTKQPVHFTKRRIVKNLLVLAIGCFLSYCAYDGLTVLQSTFNRDGGIGMISMSVQYGCGSITALLFTKYLLKKFGSESVIVVTSATYVVYVAANLYPSWYLLMPASVIVGLANSLFWAAQCQYLNGLSILYAGHQNKDKKVETLKGKHKLQRRNSTQRDYEQRENCNSITEGKYTQYDAYEKDNYALQREKIEPKKNTNNESNELHDNEYQIKNNPDQNSDIGTERYFYSVEASASSGKILENCKSVSSKIVTNCEFKVVESTTSRMFGLHGFIVQTCYIWSNLLSYYVIKSGLTDNDYIHNSTCMCGADFCNVETECFIHNLQEPTEETKCILIGILVAISILAVLLVALFLDKLEKKEEAMLLTWEVLYASFRHMKDKFEILLAPYVVLVGVAQGFVMGDFPKAYIGCAWGMHHVGLVIACFGACLALSCTLSGWFVKHVGRMPIFLTGEASIVAAGILLLKWHPDAENPAMFFVVAGMIGVSKGILWSQLRAFYGVLFKEDAEVAFGNYNIFQSLGATIAFGYSNFLCTSTKIYIFLAISVVGCIGYLLAEKSHSLNSLK